MSVKIDKTQSKHFRKPGVYLFVDLDDNFLYAGSSTNIRNRIEHHFIAYNSSIVTDGTIDLFEVKEVHVWFVESVESPEELKKLLKAKEGRLLEIFQPRMNLYLKDQERMRIEISEKDQKEELNVADEKLEISWPSGVDRNNLFVRTKRKAEHIRLVLEKTELSGKKTQKIKQQLQIHVEDLNKLIEKLLLEMED